MGPEFGLGKVPKYPNRAMTLIANFPVFQIPSVGDFQIKIRLDDRVYESGFSIAFQDGFGAHHCARAGGLNRPHCPPNRAKKINA